MIKKKFLIEVEYTDQELKDFAEANNLSIEQLTDEKIASLWFESLDAEYTGIISVTVDLTPAPQE